jgi:hypothetical protein
MKLMTLIAFLLFSSALFFSGNVKADGSLWFENFKWLDHSLSAELSATGGIIYVIYHYPLSFTDKTEVLCTR